MKYNDCIKKGIKDTSWIDDFCVNCLDGLGYNKRVCTEKMLNALTKYTRSITYLIDRYTTRLAEIYINNTTGYALAIVDTKYNKEVRIYDIKKEIEAEYTRQLENLVNDRRYKKVIAIEEILAAYKELYKVEAEDYNYIGLNLDNNKTNNLLVNDPTNTIQLIEKIDDLEEEYNV